MQKMKMYSIYDQKTGLYSPPGCYINTPHAIREFTKLFRGQNGFNQFPGDYNIVEVGEFDDTTGKMIPMEAMFICNGNELVSEIKETRPCTKQQHKEKE